MKKPLLAVLLAMGVAGVFAKDVYVQGHFRKDGTYVEPHHRSSPDRSTYNNYSTQGNYNPYSGQTGTVNPQQSYQPVNPTYSHPSGIYGGQKAPKGWY